MNLSKKKALTSEDIWAMFAESERLMREDRIEAARRKEELDRKFAETDRLIKELRASNKELSANIGGISNSNGRFAEEYFYNSLERQMKFAEIHFDRISRSIKNSVKTSDGKNLEDEFDIVMYNEKSIALIEVKYKAADEYIKDLVTRKVKNFKTLFPNYEKFKIYLGLGSFSFDKKTIETAKKCGIGLLKQVGEAIEYKADWDLKAY